MKHHTRRDLLRAGVALGALLLAASAFGQGKQNQVQTGLVDAHGASWRFPESTFAGLPAAAAGNLGWRYTVTDCATSACTSGGGSTKADVRSNGSTYDVISGGGGTSATNPFASGTLTANPIPSARFTVEVSGSNLVVKDLSGATLSTTAMNAGSGQQDITLLSGVSGLVRYDHVQLSETTQFTGTSLGTIKLSIGRPGLSTDDEMLPQTLFAQSSGDTWFSFDRPQPPAITSTYAIALGIRVTGGTGFVNLLTAGKVTVEVSGYAIQ